MAAPENLEDFSELDDSALISWRVSVRAELEHLAPHSREYWQLAASYDISTQEIDDRARRAWRGQDTTGRWENNHD